MNTATKDYLIKTVFRTNTLPVISECNTSCIFCSHKQNPADIETFRMPKMDLDEFKEVIEFLSPDRKIVIGESATRIVEGEPFLYKDILPLLAMIRSKFKNTAIQVTSNGTLLNEEKVEYLMSLGNIELNISLNCVDPLKRKVILGKNACPDIKEKIRLLKDKIVFSGSCVVVPEIMDKYDLEEIVGLLDENGAQSVRIFLPGYSKLSGQSIPLQEIHDKTAGYVAELRNKYTLPIIIEPCMMYSLECNVEGVIKGLPASAAGLKHGDIILRVNRKMIRSRVEAFDRAYRLKNPVLTIVRDGTEKELVLEKDKNESPGFIVIYDVAPETEKLIRKTVDRHGAKKVLFITSELAYKIIEEYVRSCGFDFEYEVLSAQNRFFGGTIHCAGLLTARDVVECAGKHIEKKDKPELIILPAVMFDSDKRDLLGISIQEVEGKLGISVDIL